MAAPWDRITDDAYKSWRLEDMTTEEYNELGPVARRSLRTQFQQQQAGVSASAVVGQPSHEELIARRSLALQNAWSTRLPSVPTITELPNVVQSALLAPLPSPLRSTAVAERGLLTTW